MTLQLAWKNLSSKESVLDPHGPVVSMTTYGARTELAYLAIESIARGRLRPSRFILWLEARHELDEPPKSLQRLAARGLEIHPAQKIGPHNKYYPYVENETGFTLPLATADDDTLYPLVWLQQLYAAFRSNPNVIHCHRARRMGLDANGFLPYIDWSKCRTTHPSHLHFVTGVSGAIYPPELQALLKQAGAAFVQCCPTADDIWLTAIALRSGFKVAQVHALPRKYPVVPGTQRHKLFAANVLRGDNQAQLIRTFSQHEIAQLYALQKSGSH